MRQYRNALERATTAHHPQQLFTGDAIAEALKYYRLKTTSKDYDKFVERPNSPKEEHRGVLLNENKAVAYHVKPTVAEFVIDVDLAVEAVLPRKMHSDFYEAYVENEDDRLIDKIFGNRRYALEFFVGAKFIVKSLNKDYFVTQRRWREK